MLALVLRLAPIFALPLNLRHGTDPWDYKRMATSIAESGSYPESYSSTLHGNHGGPTAARPPLYPLLLATASKVSGDSVTAARLLQALIGVGLVFLIGLCARMLFGERTAVITLFLAAIYVPLIDIGTTLMSEALLLPLLVALLISLIKARRAEAPTRWAIWCGLLVGLATLTRANAIILIVPAAIALWRRPRRAHWRLPIACSAACVVVLIPWTVRNFVVMHHFVPLTTELGPLLAGTYNSSAANDHNNPYAFRPVIFVPSYQTFLRRYYGKLDEIATTSKLLAASTSYVIQHPLQVPETIGWNTLRLADLEPGWSHLSAEAIDVPSPPLALLSRLLFWFVMVLALIGLSWYRMRLPWFIWAPAALLVLTILPFNSEIRFRLPIDPLLLLLSGSVIAAMPAVRDMRSARARWHAPSQRAEV